MNKFLKFISYESFFHYNLQILLNAKANARYHGIAGSSPLLEINRFEFQRSFTPDYLHSICRGVNKFDDGLDQRKERRPLVLSPNRKWTF